MTEVVWAERGDDAAVADSIAAIVVRPGTKSLAIPGGRTPATILALLRQQSLPWDRVTITPTDERLVPHNHPASNFGSLTRALSGVAARLLPLDDSSRPRRFDLVWLGMGTDGHIASLFPKGAVERLPTAGVVRVMPNPLPPEAPFERLSLTLDALIDCDALFIVVRGAEKRAVLAAAIAGQCDLPIAKLIAAARCPVTIFWSEP